MLAFPSPRILTARRIGGSVAALALAVGGTVSAATAHSTTAHSTTNVQHQQSPASRAEQKAASLCLTTTSTGPVPHPADVEFLRSRRSLLGLHRWYLQIGVGGIPVVGGLWGWHRYTDTGVVTVDDCRVPTGKLNTTSPKVRPAAARAAAKAGVRGRMLSKKLMALPFNGATRLVWAVTTMNGQGALTSYVDAVNSRVLKTEVSSESSRSPKDTVGTARVFDPNPIAKLQDETLRDRHDRADALPATAYTVRGLRRLNGQGRTLVGTWATVVNEDRASSPTATYDYNRHDDYFEQVMAYYAVDAEQAFLQRLGFTDVNAESQQILADGMTDDNSFYTPDLIVTGTGGVDDAEDPEVTWHEYGHAVQDDQVPDWGGSYQGAAIGEGFGDYMAVTMSQPTAASTAAVPSACVMDWDATSYTIASPHCLRRTDTNLVWTGLPLGDPHIDGEIWSAALWDINQQLGRREATRIIVEAQFWMNPSVGFQEAAEATIGAAQKLYPGDADVVAGAFASRGLFVG